MDILSHVLNALAAYDLFNDAETVDVDYILMGPSMSGIDDTIAKAQHIISIAAARKDCIAFVSPFRGDVIGQPKTFNIVARTVNYFDQLTSTSYAVFDNNYKYIYDKYNDVYRYIPCNADVAGLTLSTTLNSRTMVLTCWIQQRTTIKRSQTCLLTSKRS